MEMIEKVGRALAASFMNEVSISAMKPFDQTGVHLPSKEVWDTYARAAIEAMREPTDEMKDAWNRDFDDWLAERIEAEYHPYQVMIDTALSLSQAHQQIEEGN